MPHSKPRLDETAKAARRQETLQRYAIKNRKKLRGAAQERMQCLRQRPRTTAQKESRTASDAKYRRQKLEEDGRAASPENATLPCRRKAATPAAPRWKAASVPTTAQRIFLPEELNSSKDDEDDSEAISAGQFYCSQRRPRSPTPPAAPVEPACSCVWPAYCAKCTCSCDQSSCLAHHENEDVMRKMLKEMALEEALVRREEALVDLARREKEKVRWEMARAKLLGR
ncbi:hypothetical protein DFH09DRAFT_1331663 [Mycena vulgaris]|nr:hypothetical protein DFH09DRAFT_1331663 [Mycena vulgaris]